MKSLIIATSLLYAVLGYSNTLNQITAITQAEAVAAISDNGQVVVGYTNTTTPTGFLLLTELNQYTTLGTTSAATAVSADSTTNSYTVGGYSNGKPTLFSQTDTTQLSTSTKGPYGIVTSISLDEATVAGYLQSSTGLNRAAFWKNGTLTDLGTTRNSSYISAMSGSGDLLGGYTKSATGVYSGFLFDTTSGARTAVNTLINGATQSLVSGLSRDGTTVTGQVITSKGTSSFFYNRVSSALTLVANALFTTYAADGTLAGGVQNGTTAAVWDNTNGVRTLQSILTSLSIDTSGWTIFSSINALATDGKNYYIGGSGTYQGNKSAYYIAVSRKSIDPNVAVTPIPEASQVYAVLISAGLITIRAIHRKRKTSTKKVDNTHS